MFIVRNNCCMCVDIGIPVKLVHILYFPVRFVDDLVLLVERPVQSQQE